MASLVVYIGPQVRLFAALGAISSQVQFGLMKHNPKL